jgi:hypothetical protein
MNLGDGNDWEGRGREGWAGKNDFECAHRQEGTLLFSIDNSTTFTTKSTCIEVGKSNHLREKNTLKYKWDLRLCVQER